MRIVSVEAVAEKWLVPRLASFRAAWPCIAIEVETNHRSVDPARRDFDAWLACSGETSAPRPLTRREETLLEETLCEEALLPVCSPALLATIGRPRGPAELRHRPLLYDLGWDADWSYWFARQGQPTPDLSRALGFRFYSMLVQAAASGLGAAIGRPMLIAVELNDRTLVPLTALRPPGGGARALLPNHHRRLAAEARAAGVPVATSTGTPPAAAGDERRSHRPKGRRRARGERFAHDAIPIRVPHVLMDRARTQVRGDPVPARLLAPD